jgi:aspartyl-tRNA(Asn)/glutamyl-tRNA(Gln) amidotransferase subunit B
VKNMNSFANVERALIVERDRQIRTVESGERVRQVTLLFNAATGDVRPMRSKEESHDYRYFPDPDLPPLVLSRLWIEQQHAALPELPAAKQDRFMSVLGLPPYDAGVLAADRTVADYFEAVVAQGVEPKTASNWVINDAIRAFNETGRFPVAPKRLAALVALVKAGTISNQAGKRIFTELDQTDETPAAIAERLGLVQVGDADALGVWVDEVLAANPKELERYRGGETKLIGFFTGQVMKKSGGKADPKKIGAVLQEKLQ